jgi:hypothetical protein
LKPLSAHITQHKAKTLLAQPDQVVKISPDFGLWPGGAVGKGHLITWNRQTDLRDDHIFPKRFQVFDLHLTKIIYKSILSYIKQNATLEVPKCQSQTPL